MSTIPPPKPEELQTSSDEMTRHSRLTRQSAAWTALAVLVAALVLILIL